MICPVCLKRVDVVDGVVKQHVDTASWTCPMSKQHAPACVLREAALEESAATVVRLAAELRDDLGAFHHQLDHADRGQLREWLVIALAAIDIDRTPTELFSWVTELAYEGAA